MREHRGTHAGACHAVLQTHGHDAQRLASELEMQEMSISSGARGCAANNGRAQRTVSCATRRHRG
jgi:hypothetical protein